MVDVRGVLNFFEDTKVPRAGLLANSTDRVLGVRVRSFCVRTRSRAGWRRLIHFRFKLLQNLLSTFVRHSSGSRCDSRVYRDVEGESAW